MAQLGVTLVMSIIRGTLRMNCLSSNDNELLKGNLVHATAAYQLYWLAFELYRHDMEYSIISSGKTLDRTVLDHRFSLSLLGCVTASQESRLWEEGRPSAEAHSTTSVEQADTISAASLEFHAQFSSPLISAMGGSIYTLSCSRRQYRCRYQAGK